MLQIQRGTTCIWQTVGSWKGYGEMYHFVCALFFHFFLGICFCQLGGSSTGLTGSLVWRSMGLLRDLNFCQVVDFNVNYDSDILDCWLYGVTSLSAKHLVRLWKDKIHFGKACLAAWGNEEVHWYLHGNI